MMLIVNKAPANFVHPNTGAVMAVFPETGVYFLYGSNSAYVSSLALPAKSVIVPIPQEYVEGLEVTAADATEAKTAAEAAQTTANEAKTAATTAQETAEQAIGADVIKGNYVLRTGQPRYAGYGFAILYKKSSGAEEEQAILSDQGIFITDTASSSVTSLTADYLTIAGNVGNNSCIAANVNARSSNNASLVIKHSGVYTELESNGVINCPNGTLEIGGTSGVKSNSGIILRSSTFGSNKKFKITVDDSGVPSFTDTGDTANKFMPVKDVQVAGSSVLVNGVANVPIASETTPGVVSILAPADSGIWNDNGSLKVSYATDAEISSRTGTRKTIVCSNLDTAIKVAMCDGKGAAWTDVERLAALLRLGCTVGDDGIVRWTAQTGG